MSKVSETFKIGDKEIKRLGYGAMKITKKGMTGEPDDPEEMKKVLKRVVELGINFIDTADTYGPYVSERLIGEALAPYPDDLLIATKVGILNKGTADNHDVSLDGSPEHIREGIALSMLLKKSRK
jgi:pyridoxine 4-dehydrogenase